MKRLMFLLLVAYTMTGNSFASDYTRCPQCFEGNYLIRVQASSSTGSTESRLRTTIAQLKSGSPDYDQMQPVLRIAVRQQLTSVESRLKALGDLQSMSFEGQQNGADVYQVNFTNGPTTWLIAVAPDGKLAALWFQ
jgi:hypothetical protein